MLAVSVFIFNRTASYRSNVPISNPSYHVFARLLLRRMFLRLLDGLLAAISHRCRDIIITTCCQIRDGGFGSNGTRRFFWRRTRPSTTGVRMFEERMLQAEKRAGQEEAYRGWECEDIQGQA